jgi:hypothetical protein
MVQSVDPTVERSLRGPQDFEFSEVMRPRPAEPIKASGPGAASTGRTHDRKRPVCTIEKNVLAKLGPSTHGPGFWDQGLSWKRVGSVVRRSGR